MISKSTSFLLLLGILCAVLAASPAALSNAAHRGILRRTQRQNNPPRVVSPCPAVLSNINVNRDKGQWAGLVSYSPEKSGFGVVLDIELDKRAYLIGTTYGEVSSNDSITHTIREDNTELDAGEVVVIRFFVKYNTKEDPPVVRTIRFNGRQICPEGDGPAVAVPAASPPPIVTQAVTSTSAPPTIFTTYAAPPIRTTSAPPIVSSSDRNVDVQVTTTVASSSVSRRPPGETSRLEVVPETYAVNGNFKINSNASVVVLLVARPPNVRRAKDGGEVETKMESFEDLLDLVFNRPKQSSGSHSPTVVQVLGDQNGQSDEDDEPPPFTSNGHTSSGQSTRMNGANNRLEGSGSDLAQWTSPCEGVFSYLTGSIKSDTWFGTLTLTSREEIIGIRLDFELDKPSRVFGAWLGVATTTDDIHYTIWNPSAEIASGETIVVRIFSKYDREDTNPPKIVSVRFNGRRICPAG